MPQLLKRSFFLQETTHVAESLLGCYLHRHINGKSLTGRIVETEAYLGLKDPSCHSYGGRKTLRNQSMYLPGGFSYVYFTYGMHYCFNVVTGGEDQPEAVLIRALEPLEGLSEMRKHRGKHPLTKLCNGPAKLCQAFSITKSLDAKDLSQRSQQREGQQREGQQRGGQQRGRQQRKGQQREGQQRNQQENQQENQEKEIYLSAGGKKPTNIETDMRVGLPLEKDSSYWLLRFYEQDSPFVSLKSPRIHLKLKY